MPSLKQIRENKKTKNEYLESKHYTHPSGISLSAKIIKKQNIMLINEICKLKNLNKEEKLELMEKFIKVNYYCPTITKYQKKEKNQLI